MKINNFDKSDLSGSFVYFIFTKELLYIGETQKIAFVRWVSHLYTNGTLRQKIRQFGDPQFDYLERLHFLSINCDDLRENFHEIRWKTITQAVEHSLHVLLQTTQTQLLEAYYEKYEPTVNEYIIISDTTRTAPRNINLREQEFADRYAEDIVSHICNYL